MAYAVPKQWAHGDVPTGAFMQRYSDSLNAIKAYTDYSHQNKGGDAGEVTGSEWCFVHVHRWLHFKSTGEITDPDDADNSVSLAEVDNWWTSYDLQSVSWLYPGKMYIVTGLAGVFEHWEP